MGFALVDDASLVSRTNLEFKFGKWGTILNRLRNAGARVFDIEETYKRYIGYDGCPPEHDFVIVKKYTKGSLDPMSGVKQSS
jgi:hypothetical protein